MAMIAEAQSFKKLPPSGDAINPAERNMFEQRVTELQQTIDGKASALEDADQWRPDVEVLVRAVRLAIEQDLFFKPADVRRAKELLRLADARLEAVENGERGLRLLGLAEKTLDEPQLLVGGFRSRIDDSVQPYGLVVPAGFEAESPTPHRLDVWLHGRGDRKTELQFLDERLSKPGQYTPDDTFVLHPFGRHCNAFKFAGETDVYEAMDRARELLPIDEERIAIRGFSMGGAGCWHMAVHDPTQWFAANPGAGFVDTLVYQGWGDMPPFSLDAVQRRLLRWYDVVPWVTNLRNTRVVAYSGEVDKQKQAADRVYAASKAEGIDWSYVIGPKMGHKIDPRSASTIDGFLAEWADEKADGVRRRIDFVTYTTRYSKADWIAVTGLQEQWRPGHVRGRIVGDHALALDTEGVTHLELDFAESGWPADQKEVTITIDAETWTATDSDDRPGFQCRLVNTGRWQVDENTDEEAGVTNRKRPGMQGPIDDAFTQRFLFVASSGSAANEDVQAWIEDEFEYAKQRWRTLMRGSVRVVRDRDLTAEQIQNNNLVCFGDFQSNRYLAKIDSRLPVLWTDQTLEVGSRSFPVEHHAPVFCYPNPDNPERYVVVNSGLTFREFSNVSNSRQIAMLPDWSVIDVNQSGDGIYPGGVAAKGFFDESWQLPEVAN